VAGACEQSQEHLERLGFRLHEEPAIAAEGALADRALGAVLELVFCKLLGEQPGPRYVGHGKEPPASLACKGFLAFWRAVRREVPLCSSAAEANHLSRRGEKPGAAAGVAILPKEGSNRPRATSHDPFVARGLDRDALVTGWRPLGDARRGG
jgi:hypothetical protein